MADRTVKMYGKAYGSTDVTVAINLNNVEVYNGTVTTVDTDIDEGADWADQIELCSFTIDTSLSGNVPLQIDVSGGDLVWRTFHANYGGAEFDVPDQAYLDSAPHPFTVTADTTANYIDLSGIDTNESDEIISDGRTNVVIDSESIPDTTTGTRNLPIYDGQSLTATYRVLPAKSNNSEDYVWERP